MGQFPDSAPVPVETNAAGLDTVARAGLLSRVGQHAAELLGKVEAFGVAMEHVVIDGGRVDRLREQADRATGFQKLEYRIGASLLSFAARLNGEQRQDGPGRD